MSFPTWIIYTILQKYVGRELGSVQTTTMNLPFWKAIWISKEKAYNIYMICQGFHFMPSNKVEQKMWRYPENRIHATGCIRKLSTNSSDTDHVAIFVWILTIDWLWLKGNYA